MGSWMDRHAICVVVVFVVLSLVPAVWFTRMEYIHDTDIEYQRRWWTGRLPAGSSIVGCSRLTCHYTIGGRRYVANVTNTNLAHFYVLPE